MEEIRHLVVVAMNTSKTICINIGSMSVNFALEWIDPDILPLDLIFDRKSWTDNEKKIYRPFVKIEVDLVGMMNP